jgi:hypothetical protein
MTQGLVESRICEVKPSAEIVRAEAKLLEEAWRPFDENPQAIWSRTEVTEFMEAMTVGAACSEWFGDGARARECRAAAEWARQRLRWLR